MRARGRSIVVAAVIVGALESPRAPLAATVPCHPTGSLDTVVTLATPSGASVVGLKLQIQYPAGVDLPGFAGEASVKERVRMLPGGILFSPNDTDGAMIVALVGTAPLAAGPLFDVRFDRCGGTPDPRAEDFRCSVEQGSDDHGALLAKGLTCSVALATNKKGEGR